MRVFFVGVHEFDRVVADCRHVDDGIVALDDFTGKSGEAFLGQVGLENDRAFKCGSDEKRIGDLDRHHRGEFIHSL